MASAQVLKGPTTLSGQRVDEVLSFYLAEFFSTAAILTIGARLFSSLGYFVQSRTKHGVGKA